MRTVNELDFGEIYHQPHARRVDFTRHHALQRIGSTAKDGKWGLLRYTQVKTAYHHYGAQ